MSPVALRVNPFPDALEVIPAWTEIVPLDSTVVEKDCIWVCKSVFKMFAVPSVADSKFPLTKTPSVVPDAVMFTADAVWLGVIVRLVPTKASEVNVRVLAPTPTFEVKPRSVNVATPLTVLTVTEVTAAPDAPSLRTCPVAVTVTSYWVEPPSGLTPPESRN
jgi:hypothetical protein